MASITFNGSRADLLARLRKLPGILAGTLPDSGGVAKELQSRLGTALLSKVQGAYVQKARGGVGDDGIKWKPLAKRAGSREILRHTDQLFRSLSVVPSSAGSVAVGTNVAYATYHQHGTRRMPARPLWPKELPPHWWTDLLATYRRGLAAVLGEYLAGRG